MKLGSKARSRVRFVMLATACAAVGTIAGPSLAGAAQSVVQNVLVTNTASNPVPVASQGTTQVAGTVTVANQPQPPAPEPKPKVIQKRFSQIINDENHGQASFRIFDVPEGKLLTVVYGQIYVLKGYPVNGVSFSAACGQGTDIDGAVYQQPELPSSETWKLFGGPMTLVVPGGACLTGRLHVLESEIPDNLGLGVNGAITGYLTDAP